MNGIAEPVRRVGKRAAQCGVGSISQHAGWQLGLVGLILAYYLARLLYFAVSIAPGIPPDEETHLGVIQLYANASWRVEDSPESYRFGLVSHVPYLYHLLMGKLSLLNVFGLDAQLYARLCNVLLAVPTLAAAHRLGLLLTDNPRVRVLFLLMLTNTLMLTFLAASTSYDNLVNLLAVGAVLGTMWYLRSPSFRTLLLLGCALLGGALTKLSFLPLAVVLLAILMIESHRSLRQDLGALGRSLVRGEPASWLLCALVLVLSLAALSLYGTNLLRYGRLTPSCEQVLTHEQCMQNRIFARDWVVTQYRDGKLSWHQAVRETRRIEHPGDRDHAIRLLHNERAYRLSRPELMNRYEYVRTAWNQALKPTVFGIQAHRSMIRSPNSLLGYNLVFLVAFVLWVRALSLRHPDRGWLYLAAIAVFYFAFLIGWYNYREYRITHAPFLGVQGRYLFPVIAPAYLVIAHAVLRPFRTALQWILVLVIGTLFVAGDLPYFQQNATPEWFAESPAASGAEP